MTNDSKRILASATAVILLTSGAIYKGKIEEKNIEIKEPYQKVLEVFNEDTKIDEAIEEDIVTYNNNSIIEEADYLEESIKIVELLNNYDFSEVKELDKLSQKEYSFSEVLTKEDVLIMIQMLETDKDSLEFEEEKLKVIKMLDHTKKIREEYISKNGKELILKLLSYVVKGTVAEELDLPVEEIKNIEIPSLKKVRDLDFYVTYDEEKYYTTGKSAAFGPLYYYYQIKSTTDFQGQEYKIYKEALNSGKVLIMTGIKEKNDKLVNVRSFKEAKRELKNN